MAQFENVQAREHVWNLIRTPRQLRNALESIAQEPGLVLYTLVDDALQKELELFCRTRNIPCLSILDQILGRMADYFGQPSGHMPGRQHELNADYFARIDAMDFAMAQDDGHGIARLQDADVVILGVSRTSKTPTCLYLAGRGIRAANIPLIHGHPLPLEIETLEKPLIVGLTKEPDSLVAIRKNRLHLLSEERETDYVDPEKVREEVKEARRFFARINCPVIDVTRRSIEETAAEILMLLARKRSAYGIGS